MTCFALKQSNELLANAYFTRVFISLFLFRFFLPIFLFYFFQLFLFLHRTFIINLALSFISEIENLQNAVRKNKQLFFLLRQGRN